MDRIEGENNSQDFNEKFKKSNFKWDKGIDFEKYRKQFEKDYKEAFDKNDTEKEVYLAILLTQLVNGTRIGEAVEVFYNFVENNGKIREFRIRAEKKGNERLVIVPDIIKFKTSYMFVLAIPPKKLRDRVRKFAERHYKINTHSLRYAFITYLSQQNVDVNVIAKITGHKNLTHLITYVQSKTAEDVLRNVVKNTKK